MTFAEFELLPDEPGFLELLDGDLVDMPPPDRSHMIAAQALFVALEKALAGVKQAGRADLLGNCYFVMGYYLPGDPASWLRPDVSITHRDQPGVKYLEGAPLIVFEVVAEEDRAVDITRKIRLLLSHGAKEVWLIFAETREAHVYKCNLNVILREERAVHSELLHGISIPFDQFL